MFQVSSSREINEPKVIWEVKKSNLFTLVGSDSNSTGNTIGNGALVKELKTTSISSGYTGGAGVTTLNREKCYKVKTTTTPPITTTTPLNPVRPSSLPPATSNYEQTKQMNGACSRPHDFCNTKILEVTQSNLDCDADGIPDLYCYDLTPDSTGTISCDILEIFKTLNLAPCGYIIIEKSA